MRLVFSAPESCPPEEHFRDLVLARLQSAVFTESEAVPILAVRIEQDARAYRGSIALEGRSDDYRSSSCADLELAMAAAIGVLLDAFRDALPPPVAPRVAVPEPDPERPPALATVPGPSVADPMPARPESTPEGTGPESAPSQAFHLLAAAGFVAGVGSAPGPTVGAQLEVAFDWEWLSVGAQGRVDSTAGAYTLASGDRVRVALFTGGVVPCARLGYFRGCLSATFGSLEAQAENVVDSTPQRSFIATIGASGGLEARFAPLLLRAMVGGEVWLVRTSLAVDRTIVWTSEPVSLRLGVEAGVVLP